MKKASILLFLFFFQLFFYANFSIGEIHKNKPNFQNSKIFNLLDEFEKLNCNFEKLDQIKWNNISQDQIFKNKNYNSCSKLLASYLYFFNEDIKNSQIALSQIASSEKKNNRGKFMV